MLLKTNEGIYYGSLDSEFKRSGNGIMFFNNKAIYVGNWHEDKMEGFGQFYHNNGDVYVGMFKSNFKNGFGEKFYKKENMIYSGEWENNLKNGKGNIFKNNKKIFKGLWKDNLKEGYGVQRKNNLVFKGNFTNDKKHGVFEVIYKKNKKYFIEYMAGKENKLIKTNKKDLIELLNDKKKIKTLQPVIEFELLRSKYRKNKAKRNKKNRLTTFKSQKDKKIFNYQNGNVKKEAKFECKTHDTNNKKDENIKAKTDEIDLFTYFENIKVQ